mgnify:CR=1 FL=1
MEDLGWICVNSWRFGEIDKPVGGFGSREDLFVADMAGSTHEKDQRGMTGSRARAQTYPDDPALAPQVMYNALYLGTGAGRMREAAQLAGVAATDWTWSVRFFF